MMKSLCYHAHWTSKILRNQGCLCFSFLEGRGMIGEHQRYHLKVRDVRKQEAKMHYLTGGQGLPWWFISKESACQCRRQCSILGWGRSPGGGNGNPLQYSCLENPMDRGLVGYSPWGCKESDMTEHTDQEITDSLPWAQDELHWPEFSRPFWDLFLASRGFCTRNLSRLLRGQPSSWCLLPPAETEMVLTQLPNHKGKLEESKRGASRAAAHGAGSVGQNLATQQQWERVKM